MQTNTNQYKQQQQRATAPPQAQAGATKGGAFDNLLDGFGSFGQKEAAKNQKMGDLKVPIISRYVINYLSN